MVDFNYIKQNIDKLKKLGTSESQAINTVAEKMNLDPYEIYDILYPNQKSSNGYKDVKFNEGDFVSVNGSKDVYEVINITNKDSIVLRNVNNNSQIRKSENDLSLVKNRNTMENGMKKINEAQYNISINGLETDDAETLSQMLSLAGQAEGSNSSPMMSPETDMNGFNDEEDFGASIEEPIEAHDEEDFASEPSIEDMPMDDMSMDSEIDMGYEPSMEMDDEMGVDSMEDEMDSAMDSFDSLGAFDESINESCKMKEDVILDKSQSDPTVVAKEKEKETLEEEDLEGEVILDEEEDFEEEVANADESMYNSYNVYEIEGDEVFDPKSFERIEDAEEYANKIFSSNKDAVIMGVDASGNEMELGDKGSYVHSDDELKEEFEEDLDEGFKDNLKKAGKYMAGAAMGAGMMANAHAGNFDPMYDGATRPFEDETQVSALYDGPHADEIASVEKDGSVKDVYGNTWSYEDWQKIQDGIDPLSDNDVNPDDMDNVDEAMNEMLRYAGITLTETDEPEIVDEDTLFYNKDEEDGKPEYKEVKTISDFGKDSSEGMKRPMNLKLESQVSKDKIKSICETASKMYAKKDASEWLKLDRRYIDKLIKEGVGYSNASKMLIECKKKH